MSNGLTSLKTSSGPWTAYALSLLEELAFQGQIRLGTSRTMSLVFRASIPVVLLAKSIDADWALEQIEGILITTEVI